MEKEPTIMLPFSVVEKIDQHLIANYQRQIDDCTAAIDFLHERANDVQAQKNWNRNMKIRLIQGIQDRINALDQNIVDMMNDVKLLKAELSCMEYKEELNRQ